MAEDTQKAQDYTRFLRSLRAVRQFHSEPIPQLVINDLLEVARWSGSASNRQPWEFVVVQNRETLQALSKVEGYAGHLANAPLGIILVMAGEPGRGEAESYDEGRLSERIMLAAEAHSIGSSVGWFVGSGATEAKRILGIPQHHLVRTALSLGYPDEEAQRARPKPPQARKPLSELVHIERY